MKALKNENIVISMENTPGMVRNEVFGKLSIRIQ